MRMSCFPRAGTAGTLLLVGCATLGRLGFVEPTVDLREVQIAGLGFSGGTLNLLFEVYNPNPYSIRGLSLETELALGETAFGAARLASPLEVPAEGHAMVEVPLQFSWSGVGAGARSLLRTGSIPYDLTGTITVRSPLGDHPVRVENAGRVSLRDLVR